MWIFTKSSFVSAVEHRDDEYKLMVRARDEFSLEELAERAGVEVVETTGGDYQFRVTVSRTVFNSWLDDQIDEIDYDNFKSAVVRGNRWHEALMDVWVAMQKVAAKRW